MDFFHRVDSVFLLFWCKYSGIKGATSPQELGASATKDFARWQDNLYLLLDHCMMGKIFLKWKTKINLSAFNLTKLTFEFSKYKIKEYTGQWTLFSLCSGIATSKFYSFHRKLHLSNCNMKFLKTAYAIRKYNYFFKYCLSFSPACTTDWYYIPHANCI